MSPTQCADLMLRDARRRREEAADTLAAQTARAEAAGAYDNCARFVREHLVMRWTTATPTNDGFYWTRGGVGFPSWVAEVRHDGTRFELWQPGSKEPLALADLVGRQWAGPIERPSEPEAAP